MKPSEYMNRFSYEFLKSRDTFDVQITVKYVRIHVKNGAGFKF